MNDIENVNVDKTFVRTCERSNTFANADERSQKINVNVQNSIYIIIKKLNPILFWLIFFLIKYLNF